MLAIGVLIGCQSAPPAPRSITPLRHDAKRVHATNVVVEAAHPIPQTPPPRAPEPVTTPVVTSVEIEAEPAEAIVPTPVIPQPKPPQTNQWVSLARWSKTNEVTLTRTTQTGATHLLRSTNGTLALAIGNRVARWQGLECWLGFPPQGKDNDIWVNQLDLEKNLAPLLCHHHELPVTNRVIVIDPGHGGDNPGARSQTTGRYEKDLTLDWALRLRPLLEAKGWTVFLTRTNDASMSLAERVEFADARNAELFVSLHFNSLPRISSGGLETYCLTPAGMSSHLIREEVDLPELTWPNNQHDAFNLQLATRIHQELVRTTGRSDRGVRRARFMGVLKTQNRPAVLLEGGYLSNPEEAKLIAQPAFRQKLAEAVANALN